MLVQIISSIYLNLIIMFKDFKYKFWKFIAKPIPLIIIVLLLWYLIGFWVTFNPNPLQWLLFTTWWGRFISLILFISLIKGVFSDEI